MHQMIGFRDVAFTLAPIPKPTAPPAVRFIVSIKESPQAQCSAYNRGERACRHEIQFPTLFFPPR
jgi:hypothetical protein